MEDTKVLDTEFDVLDSIEDEVDCAIMSDAQFNAAIDDIKAEGPSLHESVEDLVDDDDDIDEAIDSDIDFKEDCVGVTTEDCDVDDILAADRDINMDPFEDDEIIDLATDDDIDQALDTDDDLIEDEDDD